MKLSAYAKQVGVTSKTAYQWWRAGQLDAYQLPTGTIIVRDPQTAATGAALSARVSSVDHIDDVMRQLQRLRDYAAARGYQGVAEVSEIASGLNDERPQRKKLLTDARVGVWVVEHRDRLTRFGYGSIATLLEHPGRRVEAIFPPDTGTETGDGLVDDLVAVITRMAARISGRRNAKRRAATIQQPRCTSVSSRALSGRTSYEHDPARLPDRAGSHRSADHRLPPSMRARRAGRIIGAWRASRNPTARPARVHRLSISTAN